MTEKVSYFNKDLLNNGINLDGKISSIYDDIGYASPINFDHTGHDDALDLVLKHAEIFLKHVFVSNKTVYQQLSISIKQLYTNSCLMLIDKMIYLHKVYY